MYTEQQQRVLAGLKGKRAAVLGIGLRSGVPLIRFLQQHGCQAVACDRKPEERLSDVLAALQGLPVEYQLGEGYLAHLDQCQLLFRTPGMRPDLPEISQAVAAGAELTSEIELVFALADAPITGVTGSDGKTTTTTLVSEMLKADQRSVHLGGNIGRSLIEEVLQIPPTGEIVLELSSFQLMGMERSPDYSVITNLSPNHLDYHTSMDEYVDAKCNIFRHQAADDWLVLNRDNEVTRALAAKARGEVLWFSRRERLQQGAYLDSDRLVLQLQGKEETICRIDDMVLPGWHNVENMLAAALVARGKGVSLSAIRQVATTFAGVEHRLEFVRELDGVKYYNDSIASSPTRTAAGLQALSSPVILIAGGYDKKIPFEPLAKAMLGRVKAVALIGQTAEKIALALRQAAASGTTLPATERCASLEEAVRWCQSQSRPGDAVLLSPACASFDMFRDFEERGRIFKRIVAKL
jgi:UDP-N-acetylmuramoylalanine--D-glutamate ligase